MRIRPTFVLIVSNAGGEGKTLLAGLVKALFELAGDPVELLDGDAGNGAARVADSAARSVGWGVGALTAPDILKACRGHHVILDLGANSLASQREIVELVPALREVFGGAGYRTVAFLPVTPNKHGSVDAIINLAAKLPDFEKFFIRNDRDGSGDFHGMPSAPNVVDVDYLRPGFIQYIHGPGQSMSKAVCSPPEGYRIAARYVAEWMRDFARAPALAGMFAPSLQRLDSVPRPTSPLAMTVPKLASASDAALRENTRKSQVLRLIRERGWHARGLREVADELERASD